MQGINQPNDRVIELSGRYHTQMRSPCCVLKRLVFLVDDTRTKGVYVEICSSPYLNEKDPSVVSRFTFIRQ